MLESGLPYLIFSSLNDTYIYSVRLPVLFIINETRFWLPVSFMINDTRYKTLLYTLINISSSLKDTSVWLPVSFSAKRHWSLNID